MFQELDEWLSVQGKAQLICEVIVLTHNTTLHGVNLARHPKAEALPWHPDLQEAERSENGLINLRY